MKPMSETRWQMLMNDSELKLTEDEIAQGWHFCPEFDELLRNTKEAEFKCGCVTQPVA